MTPATATLCVMCGPIALLGLAAFVFLLGSTFFPEVPPSKGIEPDA